MDEKSIRIAKELVKLAKILTGAMIVPTHVLFDKEDVDKIQEEAETHECDVQFQKDDAGMTATFDNGKTIAVRLSGDDTFEYVVYSNDDEDAEETEQTFQTIDEAIQAIFE